MDVYGCRILAEKHLREKKCHAMEKEQLDEGLQRWMDGFEAAVNHRVGGID